MSATNGDYGLFDTVLYGPPRVHMGVALSLLAVGFVFRVVLGLLNRAMDQDPKYGAALVDLILATMALTLYGPLMNGVWSAAQNIAYDVYPDTKMVALGKLYMQVAGRFADYSFSVLDLGKGMKDSVVVMMAIFSYIMALLGHYQLQTLQSVCWNVLYCFGPLLIAASVFGLPTMKLWVSATVQVASWSMAAAIVYDTIAGVLARYLQEAASMPLMDTRFLTVIANLTFLGFLPLFIPSLVAFFMGNKLNELVGSAGATPLMSGAAAFLGAKLGGSDYSKAHNAADRMNGKGGGGQSQGGDKHDSHSGRSTDL